MKRLFSIMILVLSISVTFVSCGGGGSNTALLPPHTTLYIAGGQAAALYAYASGDTVNGNVAPNRTITGLATQLNGPYGIEYDSRSDSLIAGNLSGNNVLIYDSVSSMNGNVAPTRIISGATTSINAPEDVAIDNGRNLLYVAGRHGVAVFANANAVNGNVAPVSLITGTNTGFSNSSDKRLFLDTANNRLYVSDPLNYAIMVFDNVSTLNGNVTPNRTISGAATNFNFIWGIAVDVSRNLLYVSDQTADTVTVFANASTASGNIAPTRTIAGAATTMVGPAGIFLDSPGDTLYATDAYGNQVLIWNNASTVNGNVAPNRSIKGTNTGFNYPSDIVIVK